MRAISMRQMSPFRIDCVTHVIRWKGRGLDRTFSANSVLAESPVLRQNRELKQYIYVRVINLST